MIHRDGSWSCDRTGECCRGVTTVVMTYAERRAIEDHIGPERAKMLAWRYHPAPTFTQLKAKPCPFYQDGCTIYAIRPVNCRRYMCGRAEPTQAFPDHPLGFIRDSKALLAQYALNQHQAMQEWGLAHGWRP